MRAAPNDTARLQKLCHPPRSYALSSRIAPTPTVEGRVTDNLIFGNTAPPGPGPNDFLLVRQVLSVQVKSRNYDGIRVNCVDYESNDLKLTDITKTPSTCVRQ